MDVVDRRNRVRDALLCMQRYSWEQGVCAQAMVALGELHLARLLGHEALVRQIQDGRVAVMGQESSIVDAAANGETLLYLATLTGDLEYQDAANRLVAWLKEPANRNAEGLLYHRLDAKHLWVDSLFMALPFLAAAGHWQDALVQLDGYRRVLQNPHTGLYSTIWDDQAKAFVRPEPWGVGNGWAAAALVRVAEHLPPTRNSERAALYSQARDLIKACLRFQRADGLFHNVLDDATTFVETNVAQMLAYAVFRLGLFGEADADLVGRAQGLRAAVAAKVDSQGLVQGVCGAPRFDAPGTAAEGQAFFLLMEAAAVEYAAEQEKSRVKEAP